MAPICAFAVTDGRAVPIDGPAPEAADYTWYHFDLTETESADWMHLMLPVRAASAMLATETRPRSDRHGEGLIVNLRGVNLNAGADPEDMVSLRLWVTPNRLVTGRLRKVMAVDALRQEMAEGVAPASTGAFLADLTEGLTSRIETVLSDLEERVDAMEDAEIDGHAAPLKELSNTRREVIKLRRFLNPQREALHNLVTDLSRIAEEPAIDAMRDAENRTRRAIEALDAMRERLQTLHDHVLSHRSDRLSRNAYVLSVVAAIFLPLGFLTGLFGVNVAGMPGTQAPSAFWLLCGISAAVGIGLWWIFRWLRWL